MTLVRALCIICYVFHISHTALLSLVYIILINNVQGNYYY